MIRKFLTIIASIISFGVSAQGPYVLTKPMPAERIGCWANSFSDYDEIVGYSNLGHFFLRSKKSNEYIVLHPFKKSAKSYGVFKDVQAFKKSILDDEGFSEYVLRPSHVAEISKRIGALKNNEIYIPAPYPFMGGSESPATYKKGDVWVFMDIVAQMQGICG